MSKLMCSGTFSEKATMLFSFLPPSFCGGGHFLKERICSYMSKFFPLRVGPMFEVLQHPEKQTRSNRVVAP